MDGESFTPEQQAYLQGLALGTDVARAVHRLPVLSQKATGPTNVITAGGSDAIHHEARQRAVEAGGKLTNEEKAKHGQNPLDMWDKMVLAARDAEFPKGTDVFLYKFHGLFHVAPAQDAFMCRLRIPAGVMRSDQLRGVADLAEQFGGGYTDVTTRANLQIREIGPAEGVHVLMGLADLGIINRGAGGDNVRNITASPTCGIDPGELIDTLPLARRMHHAILNHRDLFGLPRKFNIAFDGGGIVSALADTNDIGFVAVRVDDARGNDATPAGVYFRLELGGITGHKDFAHDTGVLLDPDQCVEVAIAVLKVFIAHGNRTDRNKARLKYLLDAWGIDRMLEEVEKLLPDKLRRFPRDQCIARADVDRHAHIGSHRQKQADRFYLGVVLPAGRMTVAQMRAIADLAHRYGSGTIRLTVWQNLLISDIRREDIPTVRQAIEDAGLHHKASSLRAGLVACTGNKGCKYAATDTKSHALRIIDYLDERFDLNTPLNIHLTGCHHSCAQHYIGDFGLIGAQVDHGDDTVEGYHLYIGGGTGPDQSIGRELIRDVPFDDVPALIGRLIDHYLDHRDSELQTFIDFARGRPIESLRDACVGAAAVNAS